MYCLDSDILIEFLRGNTPIREKCFSLVQNETGLFTTFINVCELYKGAYVSNQTGKELDEISGLLQTVKPLNMSEASCLFFGKEWARLKKEGTPTQDLDLFVASIAATNNLVLVTRNSKHYRNIRALTFEEW